MIIFIAWFSCRKKASIDLLLNHVHLINFCPLYKNRMEEYLHSRKPIVIREGFEEGRDKLSQYLENQTPIILQEESNGLSAMGGVHGVVEDRRGAH